jgi:hypothetical protein
MDFAIGEIAMTSGPHQSTLSLSFSASSASSAPLRWVLNYTTNYSNPTVLPQAAEPPRSRARGRYRPDTSTTPPVCR